MKPVSPAVTPFYLSFADDNGFRGACVVNASDLLTAVARANQLNISPGGEVIGLPWPSDVPCLPMDRLMTREEIEAFEGESGKTVGEMTVAEVSHIFGGPA